ncbi:hypothetical protein PLICRDRAFT_253780 [Plicaturopsis crispa FD-325 SS-3]|nr:hypothetical protein PLICRDRAFT_253780 [Plicaturopsis crispa FD-325 SS-3]
MPASRTINWRKQEKDTPVRRRNNNNSSNPTPVKLTYAQRTLAALAHLVTDYGVDCAYTVKEIYKKAEELAAKDKDPSFKDRSDTVVRRRRRYMKGALEKLAKKRYIKIDWTAGTAHPFEDGHVGLVNDGYRVGTCLSRITKMVDRREFNTTKHGALCDTVTAIFPMRPGAEAYTLHLFEDMDDFPNTDDDAMEDEPVAGPSQMIPEPVQTSATPLRKATSQNTADAYPTPESAPRRRPHVARQSAPLSPTPTRSFSLGSGGHGMDAHEDVPGDEDPPQEAGPSGSQLLFRTPSVDQTTTEHAVAQTARGTDSPLVAIVTSQQETIRAQQVTNASQQATIADQQATIAAQQETIRRHVERQEKSEQKLADATSELTAARRDNNTSTTEIERLEALISERTLELENLGTIVESHRDTIATQTNTISQRDEELQATTVRRAELEQQISTLTDQRNAARRVSAARMAYVARLLAVIRGLRLERSVLRLDVHSLTLRVGKMLFRGAMAGVEAARLAHSIQSGYGL